MVARGWEWEEDKDLINMSFLWVDEHILEPDNGSGFTIFNAIEFTLLNG